MSFQNKQFVKHVQTKSPAHTKAIVEVTQEELKPGSLWQIYKDGAKAIHLVRDDRVKRLWEGLSVSPTGDCHEPFWDNSLRSFARNHVKSEISVGDMLLFSPGNWGHIARKFIIYSEPSNGKLQTIPERFWSEDKRQMFPKEILQIAWELASDIFKSSLSVHCKYPHYAVSVGLLKYPDSLSDLNGLFDLLADSDEGMWAQIGRKLDIYRAMVLAGCPFDKKGLSRIYDYGSMIPGINCILHQLNKSFFHRYSGPVGAEIIGPPHLDSSRTLTLLAGDRDAVITEIFDGNGWHEIPLTPDSLHIFPSKYRSKEFELEPTFHRYSMKRDVSEKKAPPKPNLTLTLGLVDPETFKPLVKQFL